MSEQAPEGIYVYQPYGSLTDKPRAKAGRLYGIGGMSPLATIKGLTKEEADAVSNLLAEMRTPEQQIRDAEGHSLLFD